MDMAPLVSETNALLRQFLNLAEERKKVELAAKAEFEQQMKKFDLSSPRTEEIEAESERRQAEHQANMADIRQKADERAQREQKFQEELLAELREQTALLKAIRLKLEQRG
jgi:hypothetical protein